MSDEASIYSFFKLNGLNLTKEAYNLVRNKIDTEYLNDKADDLLSKILEYLLEHSEKLITPYIEAKLIQEIFKNSEGILKRTENLEVLNSFEDVPLIEYDAQNIKLFRKTSTKTLFDDPSAKFTNLIGKYNLQYYRLLKSKLFTISHLSITTNLNQNIADDKIQKFQVKQVIYLLSTAKPDEHIICLGMLSKLEEQQMFLEDPTGSIKLDLSETVWHDGIYTECSFVLAEGYVMDNILHVLAIGFPPVESELNSRKHLGDANFFSHTPDVNPKIVKVNEESTNFDPTDQFDMSTNLNETLTIEERMAEMNAYFVIVSDIFLDDTKVKEKFNNLLDGYDNESPPEAFILCGPFVTPEKCPDIDSQAAQKLYSQLFVELAFMICRRKNILKKSTFVFVPHVRDDPGMTGILPRPSMPETIAKEFYKTIQTFRNKIFTKSKEQSGNNVETEVTTLENYDYDMMRNFLDAKTDAQVGTENGATTSSNVNKFVFTTNPCRIQYISHTFVIFREDIISKLLRNCIYSPLTQTIKQYNDRKNNSLDNSPNDHEEIESSVDVQVTDLEKHFAHTILAQGHLTPLSTSVCPRYHEYDYSLGLYPLPDLVVCADRYLPYTQKHPQHCAVVNPGSFSRNKYVFKVYYPYTQTIEDCSIP